MALDAVKNFATSTVATAPSPATTGLTLVLAAGGGLLMPAVPFDALAFPSATTAPTAATAEIITVTAVATDTLTFTRSSQSTTAQTIATGWVIDVGVTAKTITDLSGPTVITRTADTAITALNPVVFDATKVYPSPFLEGSIGAGMGAVIGNNTHAASIEMMKPGWFLVAGGNSGETTVNCNLIYVDDGHYVNMAGSVGYAVTGYSGGPEVSIVRLSETVAVLVSSAASAPAVFLPITITYNSGNSVLTPGVPFQLPNSSGYSDAKACAMDSETLGIQWGQGTPSNVIKLQILKLSGSAGTATMVIVGSGASQGTTGNINTACGVAAFSPNIICTAWYDAANFINKFTTYRITPGGTFTAISQVAFNPRGSYYDGATASGVMRYSKNRFVFGGYLTSQGGFGLSMMNVSDTGIVTKISDAFTVGNTAGNPNGSGAAGFIKRIHGNNIAIPGSRGALNLYHWNDSANTMSNQLVFVPRRQGVLYDNYIGGVVAVDANTVIRIVSQSVYANIIVMQTNPVVGFALNSAAAAGNVTIQTSGLVTGLTGLIQGESYYIQPDGTLGARTSGARAGTAVSTTSLQIEAPRQGADDVRTFMAPYLEDNTSGVVSKKRYITTSSIATVKQPINLIDATAGNIIVTLPAAGFFTEDVQTYTRIDATANTVTLTADTTAPDLVMGTATITLATTGSSVSLVSTGMNLVAVSRIT